MTEYNENTAFSPEQFAFADKERQIKDKKFDTKPVGYFMDAWLRFKKNKASVVALAIIVFLIIFSIVVPFVSTYSVSFKDYYYTNRIPKNEFLSHIGIATGTYKKDLNNRAYDYYAGIGVGMAFDKTTGKNDNANAIGGYLSPLRSSEKTATGYFVVMDAYYEVGFQYMYLNTSQYNDILEYEKASGITVIYPMVDYENSPDSSDANYWFKTDERGNALRNADGSYQDNYLRDNEGNIVYVVNKDKTNLMVRVNYNNYFKYKNGSDPEFLFGTNKEGRDILARLASGIRLSLLLAFSVSVINLFIGTIFGTVEGYYGGAVDLVLERFVDVLSGVPFIIVATLFQLHLANKAGVVLSLLFAFVLTGWIGTSRRVRTQFYRFKNQEYVLAAKTLGAKDARLMFKHIFPNTLGTIITSSVLVIPNVIFSESMLSYLNIVNLNGSDMTSIGTMLYEGQSVLSAFPHVILFPAIVISLLMISFNLFGNGLRDAFNPALRGVE